MIRRFDPFFWQFIVLAGLYVFCLEFAGAVTVNEVRMWHAPDRSRIVFDMDAQPEFRVFTLENPGRVVIDLSESKLIGSMPSPGTTGPFLKQIRLGYPEPKTMRLVFDLDKPVRYDIQFLKPIDHYQHRLVVDFYPYGAVLKPAPKVKKSNPSIPRQPDQDILVLIDPGHGGEDPGAVGRKSYEKRIVLEISKKLKALIDKQPGMRAELTRTGDYYIPLRKRTRIARNKKADLFVSIHADGFKNKKARGASVYALSQSGATSETAKWLADKENASDLVGGVSLSDKEDVVAEVLLDLQMTKVVNESIRFGREVLDELNKIGRLHSRRVEQAGFAVLKSPDIPSILIETAYMTNPQDEKLLNNSKHQQKIARAIVSGIQRYFENTPELYSGTSVSGYRQTTN